MSLQDKKRKGYFLDIQIKVPTPEPDEPTGILGVVLGIRNLATLSDGTTFGGETLNAYRRRRHQVRRSLQSKAHRGVPSTRSPKSQIRKSSSFSSGKRTQSGSLCLPGEPFLEPRAALALADITARPFCDITVAKRARTSCRR